MTNLTIRRCCKNTAKYIIVYEDIKNNKTHNVFTVCQEHSEKFEFRRSVKWIFDYKTRKELTPEEAFGTPGNIV